MAVAHLEHRYLPRRRWLTTQLVHAGDLRFAGGLMLLLALLRPFVPIETGVLCPLRAVTGVPCPFCGMTTSVTAAAHLDVAGAFAANPAGIVAVLVALYLLVRRPQHIRVSMKLVLIALGAMWIFELSRYGIV